jgi:nicotinamidase-related amidase
MSMIRILAAASLAALGACAAASPNPAMKGEAGPGEFVLHARSPFTFGTMAEQTLHWEAKKTAVIICDMWDDHTCKGAARRVAEMVPKLNEFLRAARAKGALVIHAPSDVIPFYKDYPQRKRVLDQPVSTPPSEIRSRPYDAKCEGPWPFDNSKWGCDCDPQCPDKRPYPWTREHRDIEMADNDAISADGREIWNLCEAAGITQIVMTGVHTNYCIVGRSFGIRQMVMLKRPIVLVRDLTDSLYNPKDSPHVSHSRGTELVIEHIEKYWCPTILSSDLVQK